MPAHPGLREALRRAGRHVPARDLVHLALFAAPSGAARMAQARARGERIVATDPSARDPAFVGAMADLLRAVARPYFRYEVRGLEHVPARGPALLVGSHNGGLLNTDAYLTCLAVYDGLGPARAVNALVHDWNFYDPVMRGIMTRAGCLSASHESATRAFAAGNLVLVYPGSDRDVFRPFRARYRVELGGRMGFVRLALRAGVPIVPVVSAGTHEQLVVLTRGDAIARALGLRRVLRTDVFPIALSLPWGLTSGFLPYIPLPAQTTVAFAPPITFEGCRAEDADDPAVVARCYREVCARMQAALDALAAGRRPWLGARATPPAPPQSPAGRGEPGANARARATPESDARATRVVGDELAAGG